MACWLACSAATKVQWVQSPTKFIFSLTSMALGSTHPKEWVPCNFFQLFSTLFSNHLGGKGDEEGSWPTHVICHVIFNLAQIFMFSQTGCYLSAIFMCVFLQYIFHQTPNPSHRSSGYYDGGMSNQNLAHSHLISAHKCGNTTACS